MEKQSYNNESAILGRVIKIKHLPPKEYGGKIQKSLQIFVRIENEDRTKWQHLLLSIAGKLAELPIEVGDERIFHFNFKAKEMGDRIYNNLYVWRITSPNGGSAYSLPIPTQPTQQIQQTETKNKPSRAYDEYDF